MRLVEITSENGETAIQLKVSKEQEKVIADNLFSLAQAYAFRPIAEAYLLYEDDVAVGFCLLQVDIKDDFFDVWRLMIDHKQQGKGYGRKALIVIIEYLKSKGASVIHMSHQENNYGVGKLYESVGFHYTGEIEDGEVLMEFQVV